MMGDELVLDEAMLNEFWRFVRERHSVFERRFFLNTPPPWTNDPILRSEKITNVYRELDRGTIWLKTKIMERDDLEDHDKVFWTMAYRMGIRSEVLDAHGIGPLEPGLEGYRIPTLYALMKNWELRGERIWTNAYMVSAQGSSAPKTDNLILGVLNELFSKLMILTEDLQEAPGLKDAHKVVMRVPAFAGFLAYEVVVDLMYPDGPLWRKGFTEDDWVHAGPGCQRGINLLVGQWASGWTYEDVIHALRRDQEQMQKDAGLTPVLWQGKDLTLRNIEHSLCEYQKYHRVKSGGKSKRKFVPSPNPLPL